METNGLGLHALRHNPGIPPSPMPMPHVQNFLGPAPSDAELLGWANALVARAGRSGGPAPAGFDDERMRTGVFLCNLLYAIGTLCAGGVILSGADTSDGI